MDDTKQTDDDILSKLLTSKTKGKPKPQNVVPMYPQQSIIGDSNRQVANQQQVNQNIKGNNNTQIAGNVYITTHCNVSEPIQSYISEKQALTLSQLINMVVDTSTTSRSYSDIWYEFKHHFNISEYTRLPLYQYEPAIHHLKQLIGS